MKPAIVKLWPKHIRRRVEWWCVTRKGTYAGNARLDAFGMRDGSRSRDEDATVYEVTITYRARRVERK